MKILLAMAFGFPPFRFNAVAIFERRRKRAKLYDIDDGFAASHSVVASITDFILFRHSFPVDQKLSGFLTDVLPQCTSSHITRGNIPKWLEASGSELTRKERPKIYKKNVHWTITFPFSSPINLHP